VKIALLMMIVVGLKAIIIVLQMGDALTALIVQCAQIKTLLCVDQLWDTHVKVVFKTVNAQSLEDFNV
jgi:hypothetical protein